MGLLCCWYALALEHVFASSQLCSPAASSVSAYSFDGWQKWLQELPGHLLTAELLATMQAGLGTSAVAEQAGVRDGDLQRSLLSPARFSAALGGITSLADGLAATVDWFRAQSGS